ncbi:MAG TPA: peptidoglycan-associated lipoprotein Pal [Candidatus Competibacteraceae bacterium]|nr:peptidoglycan-associated lipoprotein Pal [Candidatus Competibacteraceae bacterium]HRZ05457.1 peptidoglycan-associated lipoprotein Pal [Candidatus Competibacteraceae bacterium]HSA45955.1 peptidoglycan-associated lipoprotein Pal [Candidatus Competibacteraceae bacterium]
MQSFIRTLMAAAALALLASCASTGENADQTATDATEQPGVTAQPGQEAYSYAYGQAPGSYDSYDTSGAGGYPGSGQAGRPGKPGQPGQAMAGGSVVSADRIVYFDFDQADIRPESQTVIESNARYLAGNPRIITQLEGHTDNRGSREYNIALGERRANAVRQVMSAMGVPPQQIRVVSYGEERPAAVGQDEQSHALNRRVEIVY